MSQKKKILYNAIENDGLCIYLQPIYNLKKNRFTSAEVLMRIELSNGEIKSPFEYITLAEDMNIITLIESKIFEQVCHFLSQNDIKQYGVEYLEINLSVKHGEVYSFAEHYLNIMKLYNINPKFINLEMTETTGITKKEVLLRNINQIRQQGVTFSLDDFGTGEANLNYIIDFPFSFIKVDKSIIDNYFTNPKAQVILKSVVTIAHKMGLKVIAEGIETEEQLKAMKREEIDYIQGYYFSKPLPKDKYIDFIKENNKKEGIL